MGLTAGVAAAVGAGFGAAALTLAVGETSTITSGGASNAGPGRITTNVQAVALPRELKIGDIVMPISLSNAIGTENKFGSLYGGGNVIDSIGQSEGGLTGAAVGSVAPIGTDVAEPNVEDGPTQAMNLEKPK